jgi:hypothetical protein
MKTNTVINTLRNVKPLSAQLITDDSVYELVLDMSTRYFDYNVSFISNDCTLNLTVLPDNREVGVCVIEFDLSAELEGKEQYCTITGVHVTKEKEQLIISIYPVIKDDYYIVDSVKF